MNDPTEIKTRADVDAWHIQQWVKRVLNRGPLILCEEHPDLEEVDEDKPHLPLMTKDEAFTFFPDYDDLCDTPARIGHPKMPDTTRPRWAVQVWKSIPATRDEPEDGDLVEVARADSLWDAITSAAHCELGWKLDAEGEGLWAEKEIKMQPFYEQPY